MHPVGVNLCRTFRCGKGKGVAQILLGSRQLPSTWFAGWADEVLAVVSYQPSKGEVGMHAVKKPQRTTKSGMAEKGTVMADTGQK